MIAGNTCDAWSYENPDSKQVTWTLSETAVGLFSDCRINPATNQITIDYIEYFFQYSRTANKGSQLMADLAAAPGQGVPGMHQCLSLCIDFGRRSWG